MMLGGIDLGGTKIGVSIGSPDGTILGRRQIPNDPTASPEDLLAGAILELGDLCKAKDLEPGEGLSALAAVGMACPGPLDYDAGCLLEVPNMPRWHRFPVRDWLSSNLGAPGTFMNDANAGVLAEVTWGGAKGARSAVFLTMSTGMGAGLYLDGRVYEGPRALAGEIGHIGLTPEGPVGFGKRGSAEGYLSGPGIVQVAASECLRFTHLGRSTELADGDLTAELVCSLAHAGDPAAVAVLDRCGEQLGRLCALLVDLLDPEVIVLGTIGTAWFELFEMRAWPIIERDAIAGARKRVALLPSPLEHRGDLQALAVARKLLDP